MVKRSHVAFIEVGNFPHRFAREHGHYSIYSGVMMPRAVTALAPLLQAAGFEVRGWSGDSCDINVDEIAAWADFICLSVMSNGATYGMMLAHQFHEAGLPVVMGGYHFAQNNLDRYTLQPTEEVLRFDADFVVRGEGYTTLPPLLNLIHQSRLTDQPISAEALSQINGLSWRLPNGQFRHNRAHPLNVALTDLPIADWSCLQGSDRIFTVDPRSGIGCPRGCGFCAVIARDGNGKNRNSPARVVDEIEAARQAVPTIRHIFFPDDNLVFHVEWLKQLCAELINRRVNLPWSCQAEIPTLVKHPELPDIMAEAGCVRACLGFETINNQTLRDTDKRQTKEDMELVAQRLHRAGIAIHGMFIIGLEGDTEQDIESTLAWALAQGIETVQFLCLCDLPGSVDYESLELWQSSYRPFSGVYEALNWVFLNGHYARRHSEQLNLQQVQELSINTMQRFYRPDRLLKRLLWPRLDVWRARRRHGKGWWQATREMVGHQAVAFFLGWRGYTNIRSWLRNDLSQGYRESLQAHTVTGRELAIEKMLASLPQEWLTICELVAMAERTHQVVTPVVAIAAER